MVRALVMVTCEQFYIFCIISAEAVYLITKATESFVRSLGKESFNFANQQKKKTITKQHVDSALEQLPIEL